MKLNQNSIIKQVAGFVTSEMDDELVMLHVKEGKYFNLGEIGGRIWQLIANDGTSLRQIIETLCAEYEVTAAHCDADVQSFVEQLHGYEMVTVTYTE